MGILKGALKLAGSAALAATGAAATILRTAGNAAGVDVVADMAGMAQDASFEGIRSIWGLDKKINIDNMNPDELITYMETLMQDMDEEELQEFSKKFDVALDDTLSEAEQQKAVKELLKETTEAKGVPSAIREEARAERAMKRADSASSSGSQLRQQYEKERAKYEDMD